MLLSRAHTPRHARPRRKGVATLAATAAGTAALVGFDVAAAPAASASDRSFTQMLAELRSCESGGNYSINTGNGYYGAYQFDRSTWRSVGGSGDPHQNPPAVQDEMATRLYESRGWSPWPSCSRSNGLHATPVERPDQGKAPEGTFDAASSNGHGIDVRGWAFDRDVDSQVDVHVYVDGQGAATLPADQARPDVQSVHGRGGDSGWAARLPAEAGARHVCAYAINAGAGSTNTHLGCRDVVVPRTVFGSVDEITSVPGGVRVRGWTLDPDTPGQPTRAHVYADGSGVADVLADQSRPDVAQAHGSSRARGYDVVVPANGQVCVYAVDTTGNAANTTLRCGTAA